MKKIKYSGSDEAVYYEKLKNGIEVFMYPNSLAKNFYLTFNTKYGSVDTEYKYDCEKKFHTIPNGTAHFLEHQMFQEGQNQTAFEYFATLGSSVNAFTTYGFTCYEVIASTNFKENLTYLLDYVQNPVFEAKSVAAEKGIIKEEIKMYDNMPNAASDYGLEYNVNIKDKHKYLISGTEEDIKEVTPEILYDAYNAFYQPSNMFIVISGNFKPLEALGIIKANQNSKEFKEPIKVIRKKEKEPIKVFKRYEEKVMEVSVPKVRLAYKIDKKKFKNYSDLLLRIYLDALLFNKFGPASDLLEELHDENLITWDIETAREVRDDYVLLYFGLETEYKEQVIELIREAVSSLSITKEELERVKRVNTSNFILHFNDILSVVSDMQDDIINNGKIVNDILDIYKDLNVKDANDIAKLIDTENESIFVVEKQS